MNAKVLTPTGPSAPADNGPASTVVLEFPTAGGHTVTVYADPELAARRPYALECSGCGYQGDGLYAGCSFARDDAEAHAKTCTRTRTVLARFSASHPRGSWPAEEYANQLRTQGRQAHVVMDLPTDKYLVIDESKQVA